ncbi:MAG: 4-(cytidine 5'-diphospho)-2-C-methyl-D-erythritol kinase [Bacteroidales bacterium]|nr:4-(cytidine 5'-diphospho)-2-C-methyl-D-erythritol kinase [Bacteroidales bacterium]
MILFPNAKINLGLRILNRRPDGYHNISSIFLPIGWRDVLEMVPSQSGVTTLTQSGPKAVDCPQEKNLVMKALRALENELASPLPPTDIYLRKNIPSGAGLGGGSSDAAFAIIGANKLYNLGLTDEQMASIAAKVGADCPFFIFNRPMLVSGTGHILEPVEMPVLEGKSVLIAKGSDSSVSTAEAYAGVHPAPLPDGRSLLEATRNLSCDLLVNDFEASIFPSQPDIESLKAQIMASGALYTAMTGSGASVFGIFESAKMAEEAAMTLTNCDTFVGDLPFIPQS